jgi:hypothetical protein
MKRRRRIILAVAIVIVVVAGWMAYGFFRTLRRIPEAYAAWDTGTLLVEYLQRHEDRWPTSWDDLLTVMDGEVGRRIPLRGAQAGDLEYARSLADKVAIDWAFDPRRNDQPNPVTRPDGGAFPMVWQGAEPNEMVRAYLQGNVTTQPSEAR